MKTELKPCPFCGGEAELVVNNNGEKKNEYKIICRDVFCVLNWHYFWQKTQKEAVELWNRRAEQ